MNFLAFIVIILLLVIIYYTVQFVQFFFLEYNLLKLEHNIDNLVTYFLVYLYRKIILIQNELSYEDTFKYEYHNEDIIVITELSQKELIADMYKDIDNIDKLIDKIPEYFQENIKDALKLFYEVKRDIRTEKLVYEGTTF